MSTGDRVVIDFNHHAPEYSLDPLGQDRSIREQTPVAWTNEHGGFWLISSFEQARTVLRDWQTFSSAKYTDSDGNPAGGAAIPPLKYLVLPDEADPPLWESYRRPVSKLFSPAAISRLQGRIDMYTDEFINRVIETGEADLVQDIANPVPAMIILEIMGLPIEDWRLYAEPFHEVVYALPGSPDAEHAAQGLAKVGAKLFEFVTAHRASSEGGGFVDFLLDTEIDGERLSDEVVVGLCTNVLAGGVGTTTGLLSSAFVYLDEHPEERERLRQDPSLYRLAVEEFVRWAPPIRFIARTVTVDTELGGQMLRAGERVLVSFSSVNRDTALISDADDVVLDRLPNRHTGFGIGLHRCLGSNLARSVFQTVLRQVLTRLPDYELDRSRTRRYESASIADGWSSTPARFTPGDKVPSAVPPGLV